MTEAPAIGIDLGTTYSCVGVFQHGKVQIIANDQGNKTTPSYVAFMDEEIFIGDPAKEQQNRNLGGTIFNVKRLIGRKFDEVSVQTDKKHLPFEVINENNKPMIKIVVNGETKTFFPEEISSMVLTKMKETAEAYLGKTVTNAVITVPAYFNNAQRQATKDAATIAKLNVLRIINEPTAAGLAYGLEKKVDKERNIMIFDLGGGTFDVSILNASKDFFEVISTAGDTHLGGEDFNNRMVNCFVEEFNRKHKKDLTQNPKAICRLRTACERAKRTLSSCTMASVDLDSLHEGIDFYSSMSRARFEELNADLFRNTLEPVEKSIRDAGMDKEQIQEIVLVGGSTRIPKVQKLLQDFFNGKELTKTIDPDEAVAYGAAIHAAALNGDAWKEMRDVVLVDVTPLSLGIEVTYDNVMSVVVQRNTTIPTKKTKIFRTLYDNQTSASFPVYEGEHPKTTYNNLLGKFVLKGIPPAPARVAEMEATFEIDANGILNVTAVDKSTGNQNGITLTYNNDCLSREDVERLINDAEIFKAKVKQQKALLAAKNSLESFCINLKSTVQDVKLVNGITESDKNMILKKCDEVIEWLHSNKSADIEGIILKQNELEDISNTIVSIAKDSGKKEKTYCEILKLNVEKEATAEEIGEGYRKVVRKYHPDKSRGDKDISTFLFRFAVIAKKYLNGLTKKE